MKKDIYLQPHEIANKYNIKRQKVYYDVMKGLIRKKFVMIEKKRMVVSESDAKKYYAHKKKNLNG